MPTETCNEPATKELATKAFEASGCSTHEQFCSLFNGAIKLRTFRAWLAGERPAPDIAVLVLKEFMAGWRPSCSL